jgi:hypothetical protein
MLYIPQLFEVTIRQLQKHNPATELGEASGANHAALSRQKTRSATASLDQQICWSQ